MNNNNLHFEDFKLFALVVGSMDLFTYTSSDIESAYKVDVNQNIRYRILDTHNR